MEQMVCIGVFICLVLLIRKIFRRYVGNICTYLLWGAVLVFLLVPVSFENSFHVMGVLPEKMQKTMEQSLPNGEMIFPEDKMMDEWYGVIKSEELAQQKAVIHDQTKENHVIMDFVSENIWLILWMVGAVSVAGVIFGNGFVFRKRIYKTRRKVGAFREQLPIYQSEVIMNPCLYGLVHPAIYVPVGLDEMMTKEELEFIFLHEWVHYLHKDHLWNFLRCICVSLYWFHPMVWVANFASRKDSELACDEGVVQFIEEGQKKEYGQMLVNLCAILSGKPRRTLLTSTIGGGNREMKERLQSLSKGVKKYIWAMVVVVALTGIALGMTMGKHSQKKNLEVSSKNVVLVEEDGTEKYLVIQFVDDGKVEKEETKSSVVVRMALPYLESLSGYPQKVGAGCDANGRHQWIRFGVDEDVDIEVVVEELMADKEWGKVMGMCHPKYDVNKDSTSKNIIWECHTVEGAEDYHRELDEMESVVITEENCPICNH